MNHYAIRLGDLCFENLGDRIYDFQVFFAFLIQAGLDLCRRKDPQVSYIQETAKVADLTRASRYSGKRHIQIPIRRGSAKPLRHAAGLPLRKAWQVPTRPGKNEVAALYLRET